MHEGKTILIDAGNGSDGEEILDFINAKGIDKIDYLIGTHIHEFEILYVDNTEPSEPNNASIVVEVTYGEQEYLWEMLKKQLKTNCLIKKYCKTLMY